MKEFNLIGNWYLGFYNNKNETKRVLFEISLFKWNINSKILIIIELYVFKFEIALFIDPGI